MKTGERKRKSMQEQLFKHSQINDEQLQTTQCENKLYFQHVYLIFAMIYLIRSIVFTKLLTKISIERIICLLLWKKEDRIVMIAKQIIFSSYHLPPGVRARLVQSVRVNKHAKQLIGGKEHTHTNKQVIKLALEVYLQHFVRIAHGLHSLSKN